MKKKPAKTPSGSGKPAGSGKPSAPPNQVGAGGRLFADPTPGADETAFQVNNTSRAYYNSPYYLQHQNQLQPVPAPATPDPRINLADVVGPAAIAGIQSAKTIVFHAVGDTGAAKVTAIAQEASIADSMTADVARGGPGAPAFFFHLGDVVYNFGEGQYYYDQFYEPFRGYDRPIFAIPGNHDGVVFGQNPDVPQVPTLQAFLRNFCAAAPGPSPDAGGLMRSVMTQPGVYFTLDAPFVSIIGLYSNVLEGPGVISSQGGAYPSMTDEQLAFLQAELTRLKPAHDAGQQAVLVAVHHPPASVDSVHGGTVGLANDIDTASKAAGLWPDAILSGHAHLYQRFSRSVPGLARAIPYVVSGSGGYAATAPQTAAPAAGTTIGEYTLVTPAKVDFGYLTLTVDMTGAAGTLTISYRSVNQANVRDSVTVNLPTIGGAAIAKATGAPAKARVRRRR
jgi:Calcineurin-like phosphoesterase